LKLPAALLVGGTDAHRRRVFMREFLAKCLADGYVVQPLDGEDRSGLQALIGTVGVLFPNPTVAVITRPEKIKPDDVSDHLREPNPDLSLLLVSEENKPKGGILDGFPAAQTKLFTLPPFYKLDEHAANYAMELVKQRGMELPDGLARALVKKVGNDLGVLSFEVDKVVRLASTLGVKLLEPTHLKGTIAPLTELDGSTVVDALGTRNARLISDELFRYRVLKKGDPTIELCGRTLTPTVLRWLQAAYLHGKGVSSTGAAGRVSASPWYWENKILPCARIWGVEGCGKLLNVIADSQVAVFDGAVNPWGILASGVLRLAR
jgi:DNA polymerase III delta subunit